MFIFVIIPELLRKYASSLFDNQLNKWPDIPTILKVFDRIPQIKDKFGSGMCNITRCCTDICPEHIQITDNGIIPLKERVVDRFYDPVMWLYNKIFSNKANKN